MQTKKEYRTVQLTKDDHDLLREYCEVMGLKLSGFVGRLIQTNCVGVKKPSGNVLRVKNEED